MRLLLFSLLLAPLATAQVPLYSLSKGDYVRLRSDLPGPSALLEGRVAAVGADSLALVPAPGAARYVVAWRDVTRLERQEENRVVEAVGIAVGLVTGVVVGGVLGAGVTRDGFGALSEGMLGGGALGGFAGMAVGAAVGARVRQPWVELPRGGGLGASVSLSITLR